VCWHSVSEGDGTRTRNLRIDSPANGTPVALKSQSIPSTTDPRCTPGCTHPADHLSDLARLVQNWPTLPAHIQAAVNTAPPNPPAQPKGLSDELPPGYERKGTTG
jgi:hypothetical protein